MEYLQYIAKEKLWKFLKSFKPCYKWNTFNTKVYAKYTLGAVAVLNLVISGIPSILKELEEKGYVVVVLNLVISGIPSILITDRVRKHTL